MKSLFYVLGILMFSFFSCQGDSDLDLKNDKGKKLSGKEKNMYSFSQAQILLSHLQFNVTRGNSEKEYPDYFGGCYIDTSNKLLVLLKKKYSKTYNFNFLDPENTIYKNCLYSKNELIETKKIISDFIIKHPTSIISKNIDYVSLSCKENRVIVALKDCSYEKIDIFKKHVLDRNNIKYIESNKTNSLEGGQIFSGQRIRVKNQWGSVGYKAKYGGDIGFVTAAHLADFGDYVYLDEYGSNVVSECRVSIHNNYADAAFCKMKNNWEMAIGIAGENFSNIKQIEGTSVEGAWVKKYGYQGYADGVILSESYDSWIGGYYMQDLVSTSYRSDHGDSGGVVLSYHDGYILGIHQSGNIMGGNYCKVNNINMALGTSLYSW